MTAWLDLAVGAARTAAVFERLAQPKEPRLCVKCHSVQTADGLRRVHWHGRHSQASVVGATIFDHGPHSVRWARLAAAPATAWTRMRIIRATRRRAPPWLSATFTSSTRQPVWIATTRRRGAMTVSCVTAITRPVSGRRYRPLAGNVTRARSRGTSGNGGRCRE